MQLLKRQIKAEIEKQSRNENKLLYDLFSDVVEDCSYLWQHIQNKDLEKIRIALLHIIKLFLMGHPQLTDLRTIDRTRFKKDFRELLMDHDALLRKHKDLQIKEIEGKGIEQWVKKFQYDIQELLNIIKQNSPNLMVRFLEENEQHLDRFVFAGGWAKEILLNRIEDPTKDHPDIDGIYLGDEVRLPSYVDTDHLPSLRYGIFIDSVEWLSRHSIEVRVEAKDKEYRVRSIGSELFIIGKAFSPTGKAREKDNQDLKDVLDKIEINPETIKNLMHATPPLAKNSLFLDLMSKKYGWSTDEGKFIREHFLIRYNIGISIASAPIEAIRHSHNLTYKLDSQNLNPETKSQIANRLLGMDTNASDIYIHNILDANQYAPLHMRQALTEKLIRYTPENLVGYGRTLQEILSRIRSDKQKEMIVRRFIK